MVKWNQKLAYASTALVELFLICPMGIGYPLIESVFRSQNYFFDEVTTSINDTWQQEKPGQWKVLNSEFSNDTISNTTYQAYQNIQKSYNEEVQGSLAKIWVPWRENIVAVITFSKLFLCFLVDYDGFWTSRGYNCIIRMIGLYFFINLDISKPFYLMYGMVFFFNGSVGLLYLYVIMAGIFEANSRGKYLSAYKLMYATEALIFKYIFAQLAVENQKYFWWFYVVMEPLVYYRTFMYYPRRQLVPKPHEDPVKNAAGKTYFPLGWKTRHDPRPEFIGLKKYFMQYLELVNLKVTLMAVWSAVNVCSFFSIYGQFQSYLYWKIPDSDQKSDYIKGLVGFWINSQILLILVWSPILGILVDKLTNFLKKNKSIEKTAENIKNNFQNGQIVQKVPF